MTIDPETLMAYADGELDPLSVKRVERAMADNPVLAAEVEQHRALRAHLTSAFGPVADDTVPDRFAALLKSNVVPLAAPKRSSLLTRWKELSALAACLVLGVLVGHQWQGSGPITAYGDRLYASGSLSRALETELASSNGAVRIPVSFRDARGTLCRVFTSAATDGIACRDADGWALRQTRVGSVPSKNNYRQATSNDAVLMAEAQAMMAGDPLDTAAEAKARATGWR